MTFLVTGATGFLGTPLIRKLEAEGHKWRALSRAKPRNERFFEWQDAKIPPPSQALEGSDVVVHLAGEPIAQRWTAAAKRRIRDSRVDSTASLVERFSNMPMPPRVLICASAIGFYGDRENELLNEQSRPGTGYLPETCLAWEREAARAAALGIRVVLLRIGVVLGPGGGALGKMLTPFKLGVGGKLGSGKQWMSWIHRNDLINMIVWAVTNPDVRGPVNAVAPEAVTNAEFTSCLASVVRRPAVIPVPEFGLRLLFGEMATVLLSSARVMPQVAQYHGFKWQFGALEAALADAVVN